MTGMSPSDVLCWMILEADGVQLTATLQSSTTATSTARAQWEFAVDPATRREISAATQAILARRGITAPADIVRSGSARPSSPIGVTRLLPVRQDAGGPEPDAEPLDTAAAQAAEAAARLRAARTAASAVVVPLAMPAAARGIAVERLVRAHTLGTGWMQYVVGAGPMPPPAQALPGLQSAVFVVLRGGPRDEYTGPSLHGHRISSMTVCDLVQITCVGYMTRMRADHDAEIIDRTAVFHGFPSALEATAFLAGAGHLNWLDLRRHIAMRSDLAG